MFAIYDTDGVKMIDWAFDQEGIDKLLELYKEDLEHENVILTYDAPQSAEHVRQHILDNYKSVFMNVNTEECVLFMQDSRGFLEVEIAGILRYKAPVKTLRCARFSDTEMCLNDLSFFDVDEWELVG